MSERKVAFFDIDGTIFRSSLLVELVDALILKGIFPSTARAVYERAKLRWLDRAGDYERYIMAVVEAFTKHLKGVSYADLLAVSREVVAMHKNRRYVYTSKLLRSLKRKGYYLIAISQSPKTILEPFCAALGFDKSYGRLYSLGPQARFTGAVEELHMIANKANIVKRAVQKEGLTLKDSIGVGDTEGDIPMLELAARPICFNPNKKLYQYAKLNGWKIVVERKDVIYEL